MGGDTLPLSTSSSILHDGYSSLEHHQSQISTQFPTLLRGYNKFSMETEDDQMNVENGCIIGEFDEIEYEYSSAALDVDICRRRIDRVHREILESYDQLRTRSENLKQAKQKNLSYSPGAWIEQVGGMKLSDYDIPQTISLILIGPKGSGKSSLINRISKVFEEDHFAPERAQVSCNSSGEGGTFFLHEYMILRKSKSFCLYDTRGLSDDPSDNIETLKQWMSKGVRHVLKSIDGDDKQKDYDRVITTAFNCPYLSYGDDKPVVVLTHGDLLSFADRVRVRGHLGNLLGIPSTKQIFDIPDRYDPVTELTIIDMLHYCLEHADKNLPHKRWMVIKDMFSVSAADIYFVAIMMIVFISASLYQVYVHRCLEQQKPKNVEEIVWHEIRHLWLDE
ncbi:uncharacterized protein LOC103497586 isoform X4 [Cucumis melo]|uniref:Uncharacterized protein LOC103497586 isoform X4 n=1 Tax=Cucumis melo TaxID=3656 RepID=A0ABM3KE10_CUCME|nr:uncharacterized protein LOC103497586 isoform X4 [Cucumis melo]